MKWLSWRAFWAVMFVGHLPAWLGTCDWAVSITDPAGVVRCLILTLSQLLFAFKVADVPWLRMRPDRRTWLTLTLAIALLHAGVVHQMLFDETLDAGAYEAVLLSAPLTLITWYVIRVVVFGDVSLRIMRRRARNALALVLSRTRTAWLPPRYLLLSRCASLNRAPPRV